MLSVRLVALTLTLTATVTPLETVRAADALVRASRWDATRFADAPPAGTRSIERRQIEAAYGREWDRHGLQLHYLHDALLIRSGDPGSNGYLHRLDAGYGWEADRLAVDLKAGIHASSNMFKHGRWHPDAVTVSFAGWHELPDRPFSAGVAGDYRFGRFLIYPRLRLPLELRESSLIVDLPVALTWATNDGRWRVELQRYGDKWATLDPDRRTHAKLYHREWRLTGTLSLPAGLRTSRVEFGAGISLGGRVDYLDRSAGQRSERLKNRLFGQVAVRW